MNKKAFTLVELLAVIVLLSILLLLALPNIFSIIKSSKEKSFRNETLEFIKAAETQYAEENKTGCVVYYYQIDNDGKFYDVSGWSKQDDDSYYTHTSTGTKFFHLNNMKHKKDILFL